MKTNRKKKALTFGDPITAIYDACGQRGAKALLRLTVNKHVITFRGLRRFIIS